MRGADSEIYAHSDVEPAAIAAGLKRAATLRRINHMWTAPACEGVEFSFGEMVRCSHMSGPLVRCL